MFIPKQLEELVFGTPEFASLPKSRFKLFGYRSCLFSSFLLFLAVCEKCEIIKEANKKLPPPKYEYYDDYLKAMKEEENEEEEKIQFLDDDIPPLVK